MIDVEQQWNMVLDFCFGHSLRLKKVETGING